MKAYLSPEDGTGTVPVETRAEVYREPENDQKITVETEERTVPIGIADATVSRKNDGTAPVVVKPESECIEIRNQGNTNGVHVRTEGDQKRVAEGFSERIRRDALVKIGYQTRLRLTIEREAREEYVIDGDVDANGDVVMGDQRNVDERTTVEDVVAKELEVDGDAPAEVRDTVASEMRVGVEGNDDSPTQNVCEDHGTYTGPACPECADAADDDSKYCLYCGTPVPERARTCPECGREFPAAE